MEIFEIHITGNKEIHKYANAAGIKTITIDLLDKEKNVIDVEHMTSCVAKYNDFSNCLKSVEDFVKYLQHKNVDIYRVKIETPFYQHYVDDSIYMESHFDAKCSKFPLSRNQRKESLLATSREYDKSKYNDFMEQFKDAEIELCLYDTNVEHDKQWFDAFV